VVRAVRVFPTAAAVAAEAGTEVEHVLLADAAVLHRVRALVGQIREAARGREQIDQPAGAAVRAVRVALAAAPVAAAPDGGAFADGQPDAGLREGGRIVGVDIRAVDALERDPNLESLHGDSGFQSMVEQVRADMAAQLERVREMRRRGELAPIPRGDAAPGGPT